MNGHNWQRIEPYTGDAIWKCADCGKLDWFLTPHADKTCRGNSSARIGTEIAKVKAAKATVQS